MKTIIRDFKNVTKLYQHFDIFEISLINYENLFIIAQIVKFFKRDVINFMSRYLQ